MITATEMVTKERIAGLDVFMRHLSEITKYPMKDYLSEVDKYPMLTEEEEQALAEQVYNDEDEVALEKLVLSNLRLVAGIALQCCDVAGDRFDLADEPIKALYRWSQGTTPVKALTYRRALPAVASGA
jgi:DNA-directed RNA polymerase sigma subunit (sigma70/sigma32)